MTAGQQLYEIWRNTNYAWMDEWNQIGEEEQNNWERFAEVMVVDHGAQL